MMTWAISLAKAKFWQRSSMKKLGITTIAGVGALWASAYLVPGFWGHVPMPVKTAIPASLHKLVNLDPQRDLGAPKPPAQMMAGMSGMAGAGGAGAGGGGGGQGRPVPVLVGKAVRKSLPYRIESIGTVQAIASVTLRSRVDSQVEEVLFEDGAMVKAGDVLVRLDSRALEAQIRQAEATLARDRANLVVAQQTLKRTEALSQQSFATQQKLDEARGTVAAQEALVNADIAQIENLKTQLAYYTIKAPISGKAGLANLKPGNISQANATATPLTTIIQMAPIYVSFSLPQRYFQDVREALASGNSTVEVTQQGANRSSTGKLALVENSMDNATGSIGVRATFDNKDETLWPGAVVNLKATLRIDKDVVTVPREAVQMSQQGPYVFVVAEGVASMRTVVLGRSLDGETIVTSGLNGGESVITDGHLLVNNGSKVQLRQGPTSAAPGPAASKSL